MPDLDELRSLSHQLRPPSLEALADTARRRDRRAAVVIAAGATSMVAVAMAVVLVVSGLGRDRPRLDPAPSPTPSVSVPSVPPDEPTVFSPDVTADDLRRWEVLETATNTDPGLAGATELRFEVPVQDRFAYQWSSFCSGDPDTWFVQIVGDGGASGSGYCDTPIPGSLPPLPTDISPFLHSGVEPATVEVRMFVTGPIPQQHLDCFEQKSPAECQNVKPPLEPLTETDVTFGVSVFEHWAPAVAEVAGQRVGALASIDGDDYVLRTVAQGPGAAGLSLALDPAGPELLVAVLDQATKAMITCGTQAASGEEERACQPSLLLRLGDRRVRLERGSFGAPRDVPQLPGPPLYRVPAGTEGQIDLRVARGAPENTDLALLVFEATGSDASR